MSEFRSASVQAESRATLTVNDNGGADYNTIQAAINAADPGDTIDVWSGTYEEDITINKQLNVIGAGSGSTIIYGTETGDVVTITADNVRFSGFKIAGSGSGQGDAAIDLNNVGGCEIDNNTITKASIDYTSTVYTDNFDDGTQSPWSESGAGYVYVTTCTYSSSYYSLSLYYDTVSAYSPYINLAGASSATLSCWIRQGSDNWACSNEPESGEDLEIYYRNAQGGYNYLEDYWGSAAGGTIYNVNLNLPQAALHSGMKIRYYLTRGSGSGYDYWYVDNVKIDKTVSNYYTVNSGINMVNCNNNTVADNHIYDNDNIGLYCTQSQHNDIRRNQIENNMDGMEIQGGHSNRLIQNTLYQNAGTNLKIKDSADNLLLDNSVNDDQWGIVLENSDGNVIKSNDVNDISNSGIFLTNSDNNNVTENQVGSYSSGIELSSSHSNDIYDNTCQSNSQNGIFLTTSTNNDITLNDCQYNGGSGIYLTSSSSGNSVRLNILDHNYRPVDVSSSNSNDIIANWMQYCSYGLRVQNSNSNLVSGNIITDASGSGIYIYNSDDSTLTFNEINSFWEGIRLDESNGNNVSDNLCSENSNGIELDQSDNNLLSNNNCSLCSQRGIELIGSHNNNITSNSYYNDNLAIYMSTSWGNTIKNNSFIGNPNGIYCQYSGNNRVLNNLFVLNMESVDVLDSSNMVFENNDFMNISGNAILVNQGETFRVRNNNFGDCGKPLSFSNTDDIIINANNLTWCQDASTFSYAEGVIFSANNLSFCQEGIEIKNSDDSFVIYNSLFSVNNTGILLNQSDFGNITDNDFFDGHIPIHIITSVGTHVLNNTLNMSRDKGMFIDSSRFGHFENNTILNSVKVAINLYENNWMNRICYNTLMNNTYGIYIRSNTSKNNTIDHNNIINNSFGESQTKDYGLNNKWFSRVETRGGNRATNEGNFWSDYMERYPNATHNGRVWDTPYEITSNDNITDTYPLVYGTKPFDMTPPRLLWADLSSTPTTGDNLTITAGFYDNYGVVDHKTLYSFNGLNYTNVSMEMVGLGVWESTFRVSSTTAGLYYRFYMEDVGGNKVITDPVFINVRDNDMPELLFDYSFTEPTTGEDMEIKMECQDNIELDLSEVYLYYTFFGINYTTVKMAANSTMINKSNFSAVIKVPFTAAIVRYSFNISDVSGNWFNTSKTWIEVIDNDKPWLVEDITVNNSATTGDGFLFTVNVTDNIAVFKVSVMYSIDNGNILNESMVYLAGGLWEQFLYLPANATVIEYRYYIQDTWDNHNSTKYFNKSVHDDDPPVAKGGPDRIVHQYSTLNFTGNDSTDNLPLEEYIWTFRTSNGTFVGEKEGMNVNFTFDMPFNHTVTLKVVDPGNNSDMYQIQVTVIKAPNGTGNDDDDPDDDSDDDVGPDDDDDSDDDVGPDDDDSDDDVGPDDDSDDDINPDDEKSSKNDSMLALFMIIGAVLLILILLIILLVVFRRRKDDKDEEKLDEELVNERDSEVIDQSDIEKASTSIDAEKPTPFVSSSSSSEDSIFDCEDCGSKLEYIKESDKWWCDTCSKYDDDDDYISPTDPGLMPPPASPAGAYSHKSLPRPPTKTSSYRLPPPPGVKDDSIKSLPPPVDLPTSSGSKDHFPPPPDNPHISMAKTLPLPPDVTIPGGASVKDVFVTKALPPAPPDIDDTPKPPKPVKTTPLPLMDEEEQIKLLKGRLIKGDITLEEYHQLKSELEG